MDYPELPPEQANFCAVCREALCENEIKEYRGVNMPPFAGIISTSYYLNVNNAYNYSRN
jgi:hypothetical protein